MTDPAEECACGNPTELVTLNAGGLAARLQSDQPAASRMPLTREGLSQPHSAFVCTLDGGLDGGLDAMRGRISEWRATIASAVGRDAIDGGVALTFTHDADLVVELARLAAAEYACCSFFTFSLTVNSQGVRFEARAPEEARDVIGAVFGVTAAPTVTA